MFFFLSGYGNVDSLRRLNGKRTGACFKWLFKRVIPLLVTFLIALVLDCICLKLFYGVSYSGNEYAAFVYMLHMPGTTTWYIKVQLLYYVILVVATMLFKNENTRIFAVSLISLTIAAAFWLTKSTWWNGYTGLAFPFGVYVGAKRDTVGRLVDKAKKYWLVALTTSILLYIVTATGKGGFFVQNIFFVAVIACIIVVVSHLTIRSNGAMQSIGKASLSIFLVHIGFVSAFANQGYSEAGMTIFVGLSVGVSWITQICSGFLSRKITGTL